MLSTILQDGSGLCRIRRHNDKGVNYPSLRSDLHFDYSVRLELRLGSITNLK